MSAGQQMKRLTEQEKQQSMIKPGINVKIVRKNDDCTLQTKISVLLRDIHAILMAVKMDKFFMPKLNR